MFLIEVRIEGFPQNRLKSAVRPRTRNFLSLVLLFDVLVHEWLTQRCQFAPGASEKVLQNTIESDVTHTQG